MMAVSQPGPGRPIVLALFIAPESSLGNLAAQRLRAILERYGSTFELELVDIFSDPQRLLRERVLITPTLLASALGQRVVGDLADDSLVDHFLQSLISLQQKRDQPIL